MAKTRAKVRFVISAPVWILLLGIAIVLTKKGDLPDWDEG